MINPDVSVSIFYNSEKGYVFCAGIKVLNRHMHAYTGPLVILPASEATAENIGACIRKTLEISRNAEQVDKDKEELYKYWLDAGYKNNGRFTKEHTSVTIDERDGKYVYTEYFFYKQGCYSCSKVSWNRTTIEKTISNQELGKIIQENMDAFIGRDYKKSDGKYIWNGSIWVKRKEYLNL